MHTRKMINEKNGDQGGRQLGQLAVGTLLGRELHLAGAEVAYSLGDQLQAFISADGLVLRLDGGTPLVKLLLPLGVKRKRNARSGTNQDSGLLAEGGQWWNRQDRHQETH